MHCKDLYYFSLKHTAWRVKPVEHYDGQIVVLLRIAHINLSSYYLNTQFFSHSGHVACPSGEVLGSFRLSSPNLQ